MPGQPRSVRSTDVSRDHVTLTWREPVFDGGAKITFYTIEKLEIPGRRWVKVGQTEDDACTFKVQ